MDSAAPASAAPPRAPLGPDFPRLLFAQAVSLIADHSVMWISVWWLFMTRKGATAAETVSLIAPGFLLYLGLLPLFGTLADRVERKHIVTAALAIRALAHLAVALMLQTGSLTVDRVAALQLVVAAAGAAFDATTTAMLPRLVPASEVDRALEYSLALPRAGFYITSFLLIFLLALLGESVVCWLGVLFLAIATLSTRAIDAATGPIAPPQPGAASWLRDALDGPLMLLRTPRLLWAALLTALANFAVYPLFWLGPASLLPGGHVPKRLPPSIEVQLVFGVLIGALCTPGLCRRVTTERLLSFSLLGLASGLLLLGWLHSDTLLYATSFGLGFALVQVTGLAGGSATLAAPDTHRARITALVVALFEIGGECGSTLLHPIVAQHGLGRALTALAAILLILALPALLRPRDRLPRWMTLA